MMKSMSLRNFILALLIAPFLTAMDGAQAQTITREFTLGELGFKSGFLLQRREQASVFLPMPAGAKLKNARISLEGRATSPTLRHGALTVLVNGQPVHGLALTPKAGAEALRHEAQIAGETLNGAKALELRFEADLHPFDDRCGPEDRANSIFVAPTTRVTLDMDIGGVASLGAALDLLSRRPVIVLPRDSTDPETLSTALQLGAGLAARGLHPRYEHERGADHVAFRVLEPASEAMGEVELVSRAEGLDIVIGPKADLAALLRQWRTAPGSLVLPRLAASEAPLVDTDQVPAFRPFANLPGSLQINDVGEWSLPFALTGPDGRMPTEAKLVIRAAPDWSQEAPIATVFLNDQLVAASRLDTERGTEIIAPLPATLLRISNMLRVVVQRASPNRACPGYDPGAHTQIVAGSGLILGEPDVGGFGRFAQAARQELLVTLPAEILTPASAVRMLGLATPILGGLGTVPERLRVATRPEASSSSMAPTLAFEAAPADGLILPIGNSHSDNGLRLDTQAPLAGLLADEGGRRIRVVLPSVDQIPLPEALFLGTGTHALIGNEGVLWQNGLPEQRASFMAYTQSIITRAGAAVLRNANTILTLLLPLIAVLICVRVILRLRRAS